ncbi:MAG: S8 family peptidase [Clostridioides sp.]|jgi:hypothetical protein|nr:S8 family peptidase [Clostridioides sp.]
MSIRKYKNTDFIEYTRVLSDTLYDLGMRFVPGFIEEYENSGFDYEVVLISDDYAIARLDSKNYVEALEDLFALQSVMFARKVEPMVLLSEIELGTTNGVIATEDIGVNYFKNNPNISISGYGTLIAIADTGIDYLHDDFIYPDGTSKIVYLWDQTIDGNSPDGFYVGTEYSREDINKAILENSHDLSTDTVGSGTMLSGIAAGLGRVQHDYAGVAEGADLIVVKLAQLGGHYNTAFFDIAREYAYKKSLELNKPLIFTVSLGSNRLLNTLTYDNRKYFSSGYLEVAGVGNEADTQTHSSGRLEFNGESQEVDLEIGEDEEEIVIDVWVERPDQIDIVVYSPSGEYSRNTGGYSNIVMVSGYYDLEDTDYSMIYIYPMEHSGQQYTRIILKNPKRGIWRIRLIGISVLSGKYDLYLDNREILKASTRFRNPDPNSTVNYPATWHELLTVGAYNTLTRSLWNRSSRGPSLLNWLKPEVVAPGVNIIAPYPGNTYATITGTAAAAAHVAGIGAMYFQFTLVDGKYPNRGFATNFRSLLELSAEQSSNIVYPNNSYGYGLVNARGLFEFLR